MNFKHIPLIVCVLFVSAYAHAQAKVLGECTIQFNIQQQQKSEWVAIGSKKVLIKGNQCKTILATPQLVQTLILIFNRKKRLLQRK